MSRRDLNAKIRAEVRALIAQEVLSVEEGHALLERYPVARWNLVSLVRWFTLLGGIGVAAGLLLLAPRWVDLRHVIQVSLAVAAVALISGGGWLRTQRALPRTGRVLELLGAFALEGFTFAFAYYHPTGSQNWPALVGVNAALLLLLAYALRNPLLLMDACVNLFVFFGGETGYFSGVFWLGMTFPLRFLAAGAVAGLIGWGHTRFTSAWQSFAAVWAHVGLLVVNLSLWFLAVFGYFTEHVTWNDNTGQRLAFTALWGLVAAGLLWLGMRHKVRLLRGYAWTFLGINAFTFYAQFIAANSGALWFAHLLVIGAALVGLGVWAERQRRRT